MGAIMNPWPGAPITTTPDGKIGGPVFSAQVPDVVGQGLSVPLALALLSGPQYGFTVTPVAVTGSGQPPGTLLSTTPAAGTPLWTGVAAQYGGKVAGSVQVSYAAVTMPNLSGLTVSAASAQVQALQPGGFLVTVNSEVGTPPKGNNTAQGAVWAQEPAAGANLVPGQPVTLVTVPVVVPTLPDVSGQSPATATTTIQTAYPAIGLITSRSAPEPSGLGYSSGFVWATMPPAGTPLSSGMAVALLTVP